MHARTSIVHGSVANRNRPTALNDFKSNVRISSTPLSSIVTAMRFSATVVATIFAPLGSMAVTSAALPSSRKTR